MFENLSEKLDKAFKVLKGQGSISEINVAQTMKEIRKALISADVDYKTAKEFTATVKEKALGQEVLTTLKPGELLTKIMKDELAELMGSSSSELNLNSKPATSIIEGLEFRFNSEELLPINSASSSFIILVSNSPGFSVVSTSCPKAFSLTVAVNSLAVL